MTGAEQPPSGTTITIGEPVTDALGTVYRPLSWRSADGLRLAGRSYGARNGTQLPLLCLPGLTRNARDFEPVAAHIMPLGFQLIVAESRGRGQSERDSNPAHYTLALELADLFALVDGLRLDRVMGLGTSRGGLLMMAAAPVRPGLFRRSILNDIGPRLELAGLLRIKGYVGRGPVGASWAEATDALAVAQRDQFPRLDRAGWERYGRRLWRDEGDRPAIDYDPALSLGLQGITDTTELPENWDGLAVLADYPLLILRGELSDLLSADTVAEMRARHRTIETHEIAQEAHAPLLEDRETLERITAFLTES